MKYDSANMTSEMFRDIHADLISTMGTKKKGARLVSIQQDVRNFGNPERPDIEFYITVFYREYDSQGWSGADVNELIAKAKKYIRKKYK